MYRRPCGSIFRATTRCSVLGTEGRGQSHNGDDAQTITTHLSVSYGTPLLRRGYRAEVAMYSLAERLQSIPRKHAMHLAKSSLSSSASLSSSSSWAHDTWAHDTWGMRAQCKCPWGQGSQRQTNQMNQWGPREPMYANIKHKWAQRPMHTYMSNAHAQSMFSTCRRHVMGPSHMGAWMHNASIHEPRGVWMHHSSIHP